MILFIIMTMIFQICAAQSSDNNFEENKKYMGMNPPDTAPIIFLPDLVSTKDHFEFTNIFNSSGNEFYFSRRIDDRDYIMVTKFLNGKWSEPKIAEFFKEQFCFEPHFSLDGKKLFINIVAPPPTGIKNLAELTPREREAQMVNVWVRNLTNGKWDKPKFCVNGMYSSSSLEGNLFTSQIGENNPGIVKYTYTDDKYTSPKFLGGGVNSPTPGVHPCIAADESFIIFDAKRPTENDDADLFVCFKDKNGNWSKAFNLGKTINTEDDEICAALSPDGKYLFYQSKGDIYWVSIKVLEKIKNK